MKIDVRGRRQKVFWKKYGSVMVADNSFGQACPSQKMMFIADFGNRFPEMSCRNPG